MKLSIEETKILAKAERDMDAGALPFVVLNGQRWLMTDEAMKEFELTSGQTVNHAIMQMILQYNLSLLRAKIAIDNARNKSVKL